MTITLLDLNNLEVASPSGARQMQTQDARCKTTVRTHKLCGGHLSQRGSRSIGELQEATVHDARKSLIRDCVFTQKGVQECIRPYLKLSLGNQREDLRCHAGLEALPRAGYSFLQKEGMVGIIWLLIGQVRSVGRRRQPSHTLCTCDWSEGGHHSRRGLGGKSCAVCCHALGHLQALLGSSAGLQGERAESIGGVQRGHDRRWSGARR
jgi:hypothetical protein